MSSKGRSPGPAARTRCGRGRGARAGDCGAQALRAGAGGTVFLPRGVAHAWRAAGECPARLVIVTTPAVFERFCMAAGDPAPVRALPEGEVEAAAMEKLLVVAPQYGLEM